MTSSARSRFAFSLGANLAKALIGFFTGMVVARGLGPEQYGKMMFLLGTFTALRQFLDVGSSTALFTFLSRRPRSKRFVTWFAVWLAVQFLVPLLAVGLLFPTAWLDLIWKGEQRSLVVVAFLAAYMQSTLWSVMMQMGESQRLTRMTQGLSTGIAGLHLLLVVICWWQNWLDIRVILIAMAAEWAAAAALIGTQLRFLPPDSQEDGFNDVLKEFARYCLPIIPYSWIGFAYEFADRWLLQNYGGSAHQAYYAIAFQFGAIAAIATSSILNVFWKEIAEAHQQGKMERVALLYRKVSRGLFLTAAAVAGFLAPWSKEILQLSLGPAYLGGASALTIMFFYPLHQSMGQIGGTMLYATGRVRAQVLIGMLFMVGSIVITYFVLAPEDALPAGLGLGAAGLAAKMVIMQFFAVNAIAFYLARSLKMPFDWAYQPLSGLGCLGLGWMAHAAAGWLPVADTNVWVGMLGAALLYLGLVSTLVWLAPVLAGLERDEIALSMRSVGPACFRRGPH